MVLSWMPPNCYNYQNYWKENTKKQKIKKQKIKQLNFKASQMYPINSNTITAVINRRSVIYGVCLYLKKLQR